MDAIRLSMVLIGVLFFCGLNSLAFAENEIAKPIIEAIHFNGNRVTDERILRQELSIAPGEHLDLQKLEKSRQALMNLGLFKKVTASTEIQGDAATVLFELDERYYFLPIPLLGTRQESDQYTYGLALRYDNFLGLNQRLKLSYEHKKSFDSDIRLVRELEMDYRYPRVLGSYIDFSIDTAMKDQHIVFDSEEEGEGGYLREQYLISTAITRWLSRQGSREGWHVKAGFNFLQHAYSERWGDASAFRSGQSLDLQWGIGYYKVAEHPYYRDGESYGYTLTHSLAPLGSDHDYVRHLFYWRNYRPLPRLDANFNSQIYLGLASGSSFEAPAFTLGAGNLRGYQTRIGAGNAMLQLNLEYQQRISGYRQLRAVVFSDLGSVWPTRGDIQANGFHHSLGLGLRWQVLSLVDTTLRIDYGYGLRTGESRAYFSTSASF